MGQNPNKHKSKAERDEWRAAQRDCRSKFLKVIPSILYNPQPKAPSRRDRIRAGERTRKP